MGKVFSMISRPIKNFNIESRVHKIISKDKPVAAPKYKANVEEAERLLRDNPESMSELLKKDSTLDNRLKDVYVKSHEQVIEAKIASEMHDRPLPLNRKIVEQFEFGFKEPKTVPIGKCTLRQAVQYITQHQEDPIIWNSTKLAIESKVAEDKIKNILHYFRVYKLFIPEKNTKHIYAGPSIPKERIGRNVNETIDSGKQDRNK